MGRVVSNPGKVLAFINQFMAVPVSGGMKGIGWEVDGKLTAGVVYETFNRHNVWVHGAMSAPATRGFLCNAFGYPFNQLGVKRISTSTEASNTAARRIQEKLGFTQEAVLTGAASDGGDILIYRMTRPECRFI